MDANEVEYPTEFTKAAAAANLLGIIFPKKYGGRGMTWTALMCALEEVCVLGSGLGCCFSMPSIVGHALNQFGTEEQKQKYLVPMLAGKLISAEALTEPQGGSDFFNIRTRAVKDGDHYILNGQKRFIVGGMGADYFLLYAKTSPEAPAAASITAFIVERGDGIEVKEIYGLHGLHGIGTARLAMKDTRIPADRVIGEVDMGAMVFNAMMIPERLTSAGGCIGLARAALELAVKYSDRRMAFGKKIRKFQGVSFQVAESQTGLDAMAAIVNAAARSADRDDESARRLVSEAKFFSTEKGYQIVSSAMQIMGGIAYTNIYPIERLLRDARIGTIWTGSSEVMKMLIQHETYKEIIGGKDDKRDIEQDAVAFDHPDEKIYE